MLPIFLATYVAVFMAEIVGDKLLYTTGLLAARYKSLPILCGMAMAFALKMGVAVAVGHLISTLPEMAGCDDHRAQFLCHRRGSLAQEG